MRRRSATCIAGVTRIVPVVILTLGLVGCSPSAPESTVDETTVPDPVSDVSTGSSVFDTEPAEASSEVTAADGAAPVLVVETVKGTFEIETYPVEAPKTVEHIVALAQRRFYNGLRVHRVEPGFVVQFGDPQSRDMTRRSLVGIAGKRKSDRRVRGQPSPQPSGRVGRRRSPRRSEPGRQPDVHLVRAATESGSRLHRLRSGHFRDGRRGAACRQRRHQENHREALRPGRGVATTSRISG